MKATKKASDIDLKELTLDEMRNLNLILSAGDILLVFKDVMKVFANRAPTTENMIKAQECIRALSFAHYKKCESNHFAVEAKKARAKEAKRLAV